MRHGIRTRARRARAIATAYAAATYIHVRFGIEADVVRTWYGPRCDLDHVLHSRHLVPRIVMYVFRARSGWVSRGMALLGLLVLLTACSTTVTVVATPPVPPSDD